MTEPVELKRIEDLRKEAFDIQLTPEVSMKMSSRSFQVV